MFLAVQSVAENMGWLTWGDLFKTVLRGMIPVGLGACKGLQEPGRPAENLTCQGRFLSRRRAVSGRRKARLPLGQRRQQKRSQRPAGVRASSAGGTPEKRKSRSAMVRCVGAERVSPE